MQVAEYNNQQDSAMLKIYNVYVILILHFALRLQSCVFELCSE
jgi:hypothetical protein